MNNVTFLQSPLRGSAYDHSRVPSSPSPLASAKQSNSVVGKATPTSQIRWAELESPMSEKHASITRSRKHDSSPHSQTRSTMTEANVPEPRRYSSTNYLRHLLGKLSEGGQDNSRPNYSSEGVSGSTTTVPSPTSLKKKNSDSSVRPQQQKSSEYAPANADVNTTSSPTHYREESRRTQMSGLPRKSTAHQSDRYPSVDYDTWMTITHPQDTAPSGGRRNTASPADTPSQNLSTRNLFHHDSQRRHTSEFSYENPTGHQESVTKTLRDPVSAGSTEKGAIQRSRDIPGKKAQRQDSPAVDVRPMYSAGTTPGVTPRLTAFQITAAKTSENSLASSVAWETLFERDRTSHASHTSHEVNHAPQAAAPTTTSSPSVPPIVTPIFRPHELHGSSVSQSAGLHSSFFSQHRPLQVVKPEIHDEALSSYAFRSGASANSNPAREVSRGPDSVSLKTYQERRGRMNASPIVTRETSTMSMDDIKNAVSATRQRVLDARRTLLKYQQEDAANTTALPHPPITARDPDETPSISDAYAASVVSGALHKSPVRPPSPPMMTPQRPMSKSEAEGSVQTPQREQPMAVQLDQVDGHIDPHDQPLVHQPSMSFLVSRQRSPPRAQFNSAYWQLLNDLNDACDAQREAASGMSPSGSPAKNASSSEQLSGLQDDMTAKTELEFFGELFDLADLDTTGLARLTRLHTVLTARGYDCFSRKDLKDVFLWLQSTRSKPTKRKTQGKTQKEPSKEVKMDEKLESKFDDIWNGTYSKPETPTSLTRQNLFGDELSPPSDDAHNISGAVQDYVQQDKEVEDTEDEEEDYVDPLMRLYYPPNYVSRHSSLVLDEDDEGNLIVNRTAFVAIMKALMVKYADA